MNEQKEKPESNKKGWQHSGFHFVGWKDGVPKWEGSWKNGPPLWFCRMFLGLTVGLLTIAVIAGIFGLTGGDAGAKTAATILGLVSAVYAVITKLMYGQNRRIAGLRSQATVAEQLGMDEETLQRLVENNKIKPRYIINDEPMYAPEDFDEKGILLRASASPLSTETLLRPATGQSETRRDKLLRPAATEFSRSETVEEVRNRIA
jgi:hypothetical protein